jgi:hypothetical protein
MDPENIDDVLGITRCVRCGHRLNGEIECPFCSILSEEKRNEGKTRAELPKWVYITACFLTSPLSLYFIIKTKRLNFPEKLLAFCGCFFWFAIYWFVT